MPEELRFTDVKAVLTEIDWFEGFPAKAKTEALDHLKSRIAECGKDWDENAVYLVYPVPLMISVWGDTECIHDEGAYAELLRSFADGSFGLFSPTNIREEWDDSVIHFSFDAHGTTYSADIPFEGSDYVDVGFFKLLDEATAAMDPPMRFLCPEIGWGQDFGYLLSSIAAQERALEMNYLPGSDKGDSSEDGDTEGEAPLPDTADDYLAWLDRLDWFKDMPGAYVTQAREGVAAAYREGRFPPTGLATHVIDPGTTDLSTKERMRDVIEAVAKSSYGMFAPERILAEDVPNGNGWQFTVEKDDKSAKVCVWFELDDDDNVIRDDKGAPEFEMPANIDICSLTLRLQETTGGTLRYTSLEDDDDRAYFVPLPVGNPGASSSWFLGTLDLDFLEDD